MINDDDEEDYNKLFNNLSENSSDMNVKPKVEEEEFKLDNNELFLSELGNILLSNEDDVSIGNDQSLDDIDKIMASCKKQQNRITHNGPKLVTTFDD